MPVEAAIRILTDPDDAASALGPLRRDVLAALSESPDSAAGLSRRLGAPRQKLNYHLRELEERGLIELAEERPRRGFTERVMRPAAEGYLVSPEALGAAGATEHTDPDARSAGCLLGLCARAIRELGAILPRAKAAKKRIPTLSIDTEVHFGSAAAREAFSADLATAIASIVAKHSRPNDPRARMHRLVAFAHPAITRELEPLPADQHKPDQHEPDHPEEEPTHE